MRLLVLVLLIYTCKCELTGPNICTKKEPYITEVLVSRLKPYQIRELTWCFSATFKCTKLVTKFRTELITQKLTNFRPVKQCCDGFKLGLNNTYCVPHCLNGCHQGKCIAPNVCKCESGYGGPNCNFSCPLGLFGKNCEYDCFCKNNATCDALTGKCQCATGWNGTRCQYPCKLGTYGRNCLEVCQCVQGDCNHISGNCKCHEGWTGKLCNILIEKLPPKKKICSCFNDGTCSVYDESCNCTSGWVGKQCEKRCDFNYWGVNCVERCSCSNAVNCNHITGECICLSGFYGHKCSDMCPQGTYGKNCKFNCTCNNRGKCSEIDGTCTCFNGWSGSSCNISIVEAELSCACPNDHYVCDDNHKCVCRDEYEGYSCEINVDKKNWLLYGGLGIAILLLLCAIGILVNCFYSIKSYKRTTNVYYVTSIDSSPKEQNIPLVHLNNKDINVYKENEKTDHKYEEISNNGSYTYNKLEFNEPNNPRSLNYQVVRNLKKDGPTNPVNIY